MIDVCITIDIEFDIAGAFSRPDRDRPVGEPHVYCDAEGRENGLGFLLDTFRRYDVRATFFAEVAQVCYFGDAPMGRVVERIRAAGHDVQMHIHPCWFSFRNPDWQTRVALEHPNDRCDGRTQSELVVMVEHGFEVFARWGLPRPIAFRSGNLRSDRMLYRALSQCGIPISSSVGLALSPPAETELQLTGGAKWVDEVLEIPVLSYTEVGIGRWRRDRLFTIAAASHRETTEMLREASEIGATPVVILTHPSEFIHGPMREPSRVRRNNMTQRRLVDLCAFLAANRGTYLPVTFNEAHERWLATGAALAPTLKPPLPAVMWRMLENKLADSLRL